MHEVLVNRLGGLSLPMKSVVRLTDRPEMTLDVYRGRKTTTTKNPGQGLFFPEHVKFVLTCLEKSLRLGNSCISASSCRSDKLVKF